MTNDFNFILNYYVKNTVLYLLEKEDNVTGMTFNFYEIEDYNEAIQTFLTEHEEKPKETPSFVELVRLEQKSSPKDISVKRKDKGR